MYISTNVYITVQNRDAFFSQWKSWDTVTECLVGCKKKEKNKGQPESKALTVCWFLRQIKKWYDNPYRKIQPEWSWIRV